MAYVFCEGGSWLIWRAKDFTVIREHNIIGIPSLTAPAFPQQTKFLALPVELMPCEAKWLYEHGICRLVSAQFKDIDNTAEIIPKYTELVYADREDEYDVVDVAPPVVDDLLYMTYCELQGKGFWVTNGIKYGSDFALYQTAPGSCHAFALVWCQSGEFDTHQLIQKMRVSESTKKTFLIAFKFNETVKFVDVKRHKDTLDDEA